MPYYYYYYYFIIISEIYSRYMAQRVILNPRVEYREKSALEDLLLVIGVTRSSRELVVKS